MANIIASPRQRQLDFILMYINLLGAYLTGPYGYQFDKDIADMVYLKIKALRADLIGELKNCAPKWQDYMKSEAAKQEAIALENNPNPLDI